MGVLIGTLAVAVSTWAVLRFSRQQEYRSAFLHRAERVAARIERQLPMLQDVVESASLVFSASHEVEADEWEIMLSHLHSRMEPGITGLMYCTVDPDTDDVEVVYSHPALGPQARRRLESFLAANREAIALQHRQDDYRAAILEPTEDCGFSPEILTIVRCLDHADRKVETPRGECRRYIVATLDMGRAVGELAVSSHGCLIDVYAGSPDGEHHRLWPPAFSDSQQSGIRAAAGDDDLVARVRSTFEGHPFFVVVRPDGMLDVAYRTPQPELVFLTIMLVGCMLAATVEGVYRLREEARVIRDDMSKTIREKEGLYRAVFDSAMDGIVILDKRHRIVDINPAAAAVHGYEREELLGRPIRCFVSSAVYRGLEQVERRLQRRKALRARIQSCTKDGRLRDLRVDVSRLILEGTNCYLINFSDCTAERAGQRQLRRYTQALRKANIELTKSAAEIRRAAEEKSNFLAHISHELRSPLTAIIGYAEMIDETLSEGDTLETSESMPKTAEAAKIIYRNGEYLLQLINDFLDLSKLEAGRLSVERIAVSPTALAAEVCDLLRARAERRGLKVELDVDGPIPRTIQTDPLRLRQILINLVDNAIKFTHHGGVTITLAVENSAGGNPRMMFRVTDTGIGIASEQLKTLFRPFAQAAVSTSRRFGGTGLGLAISRRLAELLGGTIEVESEPGRGSTFTVIVATGSLDDVRFLSPEEALATRGGLVGNESKKRFARLKGRVLLAEDSPDNRRLIRTVLQKAGLEVVEATDGRKAVALVAENRQNPFDLVLMDLQMPHLSGIEATQRIRALAYDMPIVALTATTTGEIRRRCFDVGCNDFLTKPIRREYLLEKVARYLTIGNGEPVAGSLG
ncbi:hypothetical protein JCM19992_10190 [Thermostilla marina]